MAYRVNTPYTEHILQYNLYIHILYFFEEYITNLSNSIELLISNSYITALTWRYKTYVQCT